MTKDEASKRYSIPEKILAEYERLKSADGKNQSAVGQYDSSDIEYLSIIMTLYDSGFSNAEVKKYMKLLSQSTDSGEKLLKMLKAKRDSTLDEIHAMERQLDRLDYLLYEIKCGNSEK